MYPLVTLAALASLIKGTEPNDGIHLAVHPTCGKLGGNFTDVNAGIDLSRVQTIVSFGVLSNSLCFPYPLL
jgi:hypothetical protein